jgi:hypothetical protein
VTYSLAELIATLAAKQSCDRCGGPAWAPGPLGRERALNWPPGQVTCGWCYAEDLDQLAAEQEAEYWAQRAELEKECAER